LFGYLSEELTNISKSTDHNNWLLQLKELEQKTEFDNLQKIIDKNIVITEQKRPEGFTGNQNNFITTYKFNEYIICHFVIHKYINQDLSEKIFLKINNIKDNVQILDNLYEPISIVYHNGKSLNSGHYINVSKNNYQNKVAWYKYNDSYPNEIEEYNFDKNYTPYLILLRRINSKNGNNNNNNKSNNNSNSKNGSNNTIIIITIKIHLHLHINLDKYQLDLNLYKQISHQTHQTE
jgi:hypothetical protein